MPFANNNQWAASIGGPIKKDKLFFFVNTEGIRFILPASGAVWAWTPTFANASTWATIAAKDPAVAAALPEVLPDHAGCSWICDQQLRRCAATNWYGRRWLRRSGIQRTGRRISGNCVNAYQGIANQLGNEWILSGRVDYNLSDKDHLFWRVSHGPRNAADLG